jgi:hypothetical protein
VKLLDGFTGVLKVDGYAGYDALADPARPGGPLKVRDAYVGALLEKARSEASGRKAVGKAKPEIDGAPTTNSSQGCWS